MKIRGWIIFKAWVDMLTGLAFLLIPEQSFTIWGAETDDTGIAIARFFGQAMFLVGLMLWMMRDIHDPKTHRAIAGAVVVGDAVGVIISLRTTLAGTINLLGWIIAALFLFLTLAFAYILFRTPDPVTFP